MIRQYALEPKLLSTWADFRYYLDSFGISKGRLLAEYPGRKWKRQVHEALDSLLPRAREQLVEHLKNVKELRDGLEEIRQIREEIRALEKRGASQRELNEATQRLRRIRPILLRRVGAPWNPEADWLSNAEHEHERQAFHAIVASNNPRKHPQVIDGLELNELSGDHPLWKTNQTQVVQRTAEEMAAIAAPLLSLARRIIFVDPCFGPHHERFRRPLAAFLSHVAPEVWTSADRAVQLHGGIPDRAPTAQHFRAECERCLPKIVPPGVKLWVCRWKERHGGDKLHNRYILTEVGGVSFQTGLNQTT
jgi:hypothetical protein